MNRYSKNQKRGTEAQKKAHRMRKLDIVSNQASGFYIVSLRLAVLIFIISLSRPLAASSRSNLRKLSRNGLDC